MLFQPLHGFHRRALGQGGDLREQSFGLLHHLLRGAFIKYRITPNFLPVRSVYVT